MFLNYDTVEGFAVKRSPELSFSYLKENGELLSIATHSGLLIDPRALDLYTDFYQKSERLLACYPQYYRFIVGIVLDLEALGYEGDTGHKLCDFITYNNLIDFDSHDCRRLEALSLLAQRGILTTEQQSLKDRVIDNIEKFISDPKHFTKLNKPLFYDLTHYIFFLSDYGSQSTHLKTQLRPCLHNMGLLSLLDCDADLLSEVCICLHYLGHDIPDYWTAYLDHEYAAVKVTYNTSIKSAINSATDEYHLYLVMNWYRALRCLPVFEHRYARQAPNFAYDTQIDTPLAVFSGFLHNAVVNNNDTSADMDQFYDQLNETDLTHWIKTMKSSEQSKALLGGLSNGLIQAFACNSL